MIVAARIAVAVVGVTLVVVGIVGTSSSCAILPSKTCHAEDVNALGAGDGGPDRGCTECLQTGGAPNACCDLVGACDDDPSGKCVPNFQAAHLCLVDGGSSAEPRCSALLLEDRSKQLFDCMTSNCATECRASTCTLSSSVVLLENPECDRCLGGGCCEKINTCYKTRPCKLALECITTRCPEAVGPFMNALGTALDPDGGVSQVCSRKDVSDIAGACVQRCLDEFAGGDDDLESRCDAFDVYACGAGAGCSTQCAASPTSDASPADDAGSRDASGD